MHHDQPNVNIRLSRHRSSELPQRTYAFALDLTAYGEETLNFLHYGVHAIKAFVKQVEDGEHPPCQITILAFDDYIHEYSIDPLDDSINEIVNTHME